jgi:O-antigen ligase/polysaccharide polymerase Wzy-like membrane protein
MRLQGIELAALFTAVLNVPVLSTGAAYGLFTWRFMAWLTTRTPHPRLWARLGVLLLFVACHYATALSHGFVDTKSAVRYSLVILGFYATGYAIGGNADERVPLRASLGVVGGLVTFASLSVSRAIGGGLRFDEIGERAVPSYWNALEIVNGPGLGGMASLGMCLAPVALLAPFALDLPRRDRWGVGIVAAALVAAGIYANLALQNRTPVIALVASMLVAAYLASRMRRGAGRLVALLGFVAIGAIGVYATLTSDFVSSSGLALRFEERGLGTDRYEAWRRMLEGMFAHPFGGRGVSLPGLLYAHNLWLDVAYETGLVPLGLLVLFHLAHVGSLYRLLRRDVTLLALLLACSAASFLMTFLVEPALQASVAHFAASAFFLGLLLRRDGARWREVETEPVPAAEHGAIAGA